MRAFWKLTRRGGIEAYITNAVANNVRFSHYSKLIPDVRIGDMISARESEIRMFELASKGQIDLLQYIAPSI